MTYQIYFHHNTSLLFPLDIDRKHLSWVLFFPTTSAPVIREMGERSLKYEPVWLILGRKPLATKAESNMIGEGYYSLPPSLLCSSHPTAGDGLWAWPLCSCGMSVVVTTGWVVEEPHLDTVRTHPGLCSCWPGIVVLGLIWTYVGLSGLNQAFGLGLICLK